MKRLLLPVLTVSVVATASATLRQPKVLKMPQRKSVAAMATATQPKYKIGGALVWRAATQNVYSYQNGWELSDKHSLTYDRQGRTLTDIDESYEDGEAMGMTRETFSYTDGFGLYTGRLVEHSDDAGATWTNSQRVERVYDARVTTLIVSNDDYQWNGSAWRQVGNNYKRTVERDAAGNITGVTISTLYNGVFDPIEKYHIVYGSDGKATEISHETLGYDDDMQLVWSLENHYTDIVWDRTDGQIYDMENIFSGANRIASYRAIVDDESGAMGDVTVEYTDDRGSYKASVTAEFDGGKMTQEGVVNVIDDNGSVDAVISGSFVSDEEEEYTSIISKDHYDDYGLQTLSYFEWDGEVEDNMVGTVEYDAEHGYPVAYTIQEYDMDADAMVNAMRVEYSNYVDMAGVTSVATDDADAPVEFFDIHGYRVERPTVQGVYILRQGAKTKKIIVK